MLDKAVLLLTRQKGFNGSVGQSIQYAEIGRVSRVKWGYWHRVYTGYGKDPTLFESHLRREFKYFIICCLTCDLHPGSGTTLLIIILY
jgi:hypothetical protein